MSILFQTVQAERHGRENVQHAAVVLIQRQMSVNTTEPRQKFQGKGSFRDGPFLIILAWNNVSQISN